MKMNFMKMNSRGFLPLLWLLALAFLLIFILPPIVIEIFPFAKLLFQIAMIFMIYMTVKGYLGDGPMTLAISGVLVYFLVFKYTAITASLWVFQALLGVQFFSVVIWGVATKLAPKPHQ